MPRSKPKVLAQIAVAPITELCDRLLCRKLEALQGKHLAAIALLPYVHQR